MKKSSQNKRKKNTGYHPETHIRNANSRDIFKNNRLASQFLRNYTNIPMFSNVRQEDIEDVSQKYRAFLGVEYESDTIKKVYIRSENGKIEREVYVLSLIEHKSDIDYDVAMQLLRYMCVIWQDYKVTQNKLKKDASRRKGFRYPLIVPIVYYEGIKAWTADMHLKDRIEFSDEVDKYIPNFTYQVVSVNQYTNEELSTKHDEMSLVMLINKIQSAGDFAEFRKVSEDVVDSIYGNAPDEIREIYHKILWALLMKLRVPNDEAKEIMDGIGGQSMGFLFENMEKMDIQAERRNTAREKKRADDAESRAKTAERRAEAAESRADSLADEVQRLRAELETMKSK